MKVASRPRVVAVIGISATMAILVAGTAACSSKSAASPVSAAGSTVSSAVGAASSAAGSAGSSAQSAVSAMADMSGMDMPSDASGGGQPPGAPLPFVQISTGPATGDALKACQALVAFDTIPTPGGGPDEPVVPDDNKAYWAAANPPFQDIIANLPKEFDEVKAAVATSFALYGQGSAPADDDLGFQMGAAQIEGWAHDSCGFNKFDFKAVDTAYEGVPATVPAGNTSFFMTNESPQHFHVALIVKRKDGDTTTLDEIIADPSKFEEGLGAHTDLVGAVATPPGGPTIGLAADLEPGHYFLLCPVSDPPTDPPHFTQGMATEFDVT